MKNFKIFILISISFVFNFFVSVHAESVHPSHTKILKPGQDIANYRKLQFEPGYSIQRLSDRSYLVMLQVYNILFYVGDKGVFVLDPAGPEQTPLVLDAIAKITKLPVTTVMYSHSHHDHISGVSIIKNAAEKSGRDLRIIATDKTKKELERFAKLGIPLPTDVLTTPLDEFMFEELKVEVDTPANYLHSTDSSIIYMPSERIVTVVDIVEPAELPFIAFGMFKDVKGYRASMKKLLEMDWDFLNGGHYNIGSKQTIRNYLAYLDDVENAVDEAMASGKPFSNYYRVDKPIVVGIMEWINDTTSDTKKLLAPKYGHLESFDAIAETHIQEVIKQRGKHLE